MPFSNAPRRLLRGTLLAASASIALPVLAFAADVPATPEGAKKLSAVLEKYVGKPAAGAAPGITVTADGGSYVVGFDIAALSAPLKPYGMYFDPAVFKFILTEQSDGLWRYVHDNYPTTVMHNTHDGKDAVRTTSYQDYKGEGVFDAAAGMMTSMKATNTRATSHQTGPGLEFSSDLGPMIMNGAGSSSGDGAASMKGHVDITSATGAVSVDPGAMKPKAVADPPTPSTPINVKFSSGKIGGDVVIDGLKPHPILDLWAFAVAHPSRAELAANEAAFKALLRAALPGSYKLSESFNVQAITVEAPQGLFKASSSDDSFGTEGAGAMHSLQTHIGLDGLSFPPGLIPPAFVALTPTKVDVGVRFGGYDLNSGVNAAIDEMRLAGEDSIFAKDAAPRIAAKFKGAGPLVVEISPSHIVAPQFDLAFEGKITYDGAKPVGTVTVHAKNFDKTVAALKALGPLASPQMLGGLTMAKGLAKTESDGTLTWIGEMGADGQMKVNGLPLGKAPT